MQNIPHSFLRGHQMTFNIIGQVIDAVLITASFYFSALLNHYPWNPHFTALSITAIIIYYLIANQNNLYASWRIASAWLEVFTIARGWLITAVILLLLANVLGLVGEYFRRVFLTWTFFTLSILVVCRLFIRIILRLIRRRGHNLRSVVIIGAGNLGLRLFKTIESASWTGLKIVGFFDDNKLSQDMPLNLEVVGKINELSDYLKTNDIDYVYITLPLNKMEKIIKILNECRIFGADMYVVPDLFAFELFNSRLEQLGDILLLNFNPFIRWKRVFDFIFSLIAILIAFPLMFVIAVLIKIEDRGPVLYGHRRITTAGKEFECLKFRTMFIQADQKLAEILANDLAAKEEWDKTFKLKNDPRVTKIGKFLRKTSLDELPQFFNVLRGEMSVVGARPIVEKELYEYYKENGGLYCSMKPGITGLWQVGKRSDTDDYNERVQLDTWYIQNYSMWLDLKIIFKTATAILYGKGAY